MTHETLGPSNTARHGRAPLSVKMLLGAGAVVTFGSVNLLWDRPDTDRVLMIAPGLFLAGVGGALGGAVWYALDDLRARGGWRQVFATIAGLLAYGLCVYAALVAALVLL